MSVIKYEKMTFYLHNSYSLNNYVDDIFTKTSLMKPSPVPGQASPTPKEARNARRARSDRGDDDVQAPPPDTCRSYSPTRQVSVVGRPCAAAAPTYRPITHFTAAAGSMRGRFSRLATSTSGTKKSWKLCDFESRDGERGSRIPRERKRIDARERSKDRCCGVLIGRSSTLVICRCLRTFINVHKFPPFPILPLAERCR